MFLYGSGLRGGLTVAEAKQKLSAKDTLRALFADGFRGFFIAHPFGHGLLTPRFTFSFLDSGAVFPLMDCTC